MQAPDPPPIAPVRNDALDGLRGYAAAAVVIYHSILGPNERIIPEILYRAIQDQQTIYTALIKVALVLVNGEAAVAVFFVISGIVLFRAASRLLTRDGALRMSWTFALRRGLRIWPVLGLYLVAHWALFNVIGQRWPGLVATFTWQDLTDNLLLERYQVNGATWTLLWELIATPIVVVSVMAGHFSRLAMPMAAFLCLLGLSRLLPLGVFSPAMLGTLPFLAAGMVIECGWFRPLTAPTRRRPAAAAAAAILLLSMLFIAPLTHWLWHFIFLLLTLPALVAIAATTTGGLLNRRPSLLLGRLSFSLYLWNVPVFELLFAVIEPDLVHAHPLECGVLVGLAAIVLSLPLAAISERALEQPAIALGRRLTRLRRTAAGTTIRLGC